MSITPLQPNTIWLGGPRTKINDVAAGVAICPGHLIERYNTAGVWRVRPHATASVMTTPIVACEASMLNKGVNDGYAINDLVEACSLAGGSSAWMLIASGQSIVYGQKLESNGDGTLKAYATLGAAIAVARETVNNTNGNAGPTNPPPETGKTTALPTGAARIRVDII